MTTVLEAVQTCFCGVENGACRYRLGADFPAFEGHFPERPVLPAVVQIQLALDALCRLKGAPCALKAVYKAKFSRPAGPGAELCICVQEKDGGRFLAQIASPSGEKYGQILFGAEAGK